MPTERIAIAMGEAQAAELTYARHVDAEVIGSFGIFESHDDFTTVWNVTHKPTGRHLFNCADADDARSAAEFMQAGMDWNFGAFGLLAVATHRPAHYERAKQAHEKYGI